MSTEHVSGELDKILGNARTLKERNDSYLADLVSEQRKADTELVEDVEALAATARAVEQKHADESEDRAHDLEQARHIAGASNGNGTGSEDGNASPAPSAPAVAAPVAPAPAGPATAELPAQPALARPSPLDMRTWNGWQWGLAILGLIVGLIVAKFTWHPLFGDIQGAGRGVATTFWWIVLAGFGFFSFGWLGTYVGTAFRAIRRWWHNRPRPVDPA